RRDRDGQEDAEERQGPRPAERGAVERGGVRGDCADQQCDEREESSGHRKWDTCQVVWPGLSRPSRLGWHARTFLIEMPGHKGVYARLRGLCPDMTRGT